MLGDQLSDKHLEIAMTIKNLSIRPELKISVVMLRKCMIEYFSASEQPVSGQVTDQSRHIHYVYIPKQFRVKSARDNFLKFFFFVNCESIEIKGQPKAYRLVRRVREGRGLQKSSFFGEHNN